ncbi:unnamed protein product [Tilletia controversa]|nr:unnamed protein product [Tilletia controversa]
MPPTSNGQSASRSANPIASHSNSNSNSNSNNNNSIDPNVDDDSAPGSSTGAGKKRRIWAACESCRTRKSKCDGKEPCSVCLHRARNVLLQQASYALRTQQQQNPARYAAASTSALSPPEPDEMAVLQKAKTMCSIDWDPASATTYKKTVRSSTRVPGETAYQRQQNEIEQANRERERYFQMQQQQQHPENAHASHSHSHQHPHQHQQGHHRSSTGGSSSFAGPPGPRNFFQAGIPPGPSVSSGMGPEPVQAGQQSFLPPPPPPPSAAMAQGPAPALGQGPPVLPGPSLPHLLPPLPPFPPTTSAASGSSPAAAALSGFHAGGMGHSYGGGSSAPSAGGGGGGGPVLSPQSPYRSRALHYGGSTSAGGSAYPQQPPHEAGHNAASSKGGPNSSSRLAPTNWDRDRDRGAGGLSSMGAPPPPNPPTNGQASSRKLSGGAGGGGGGPMSAPPVTSTGRTSTLFGSHILSSPVQPAPPNHNNHANSNNAIIIRPNLNGSNSSPSVLSSIPASGSDGSVPSSSFAAPGLMPGPNVTSVAGSEYGAGTPMLGSGSGSRGAGEVGLAAAGSGSGAGWGSGESYSTVPTVHTPASLAGVGAGDGYGGGGGNKLGEGGGGGIGSSASSSSSARKTKNAGTLLVQICTGSLLTALKDVYTDADRRNISIAIAHYDVFDNSTKMFPSRILFGERILPGLTSPTLAENRKVPRSPRGNPLPLIAPRSPSIHHQPYVAPAHLQVALLSVLAHRALVTPDSLSLRDLDPNVALRAGLPSLQSFPAPSARATGVVSAMSGELGSTPNSMMSAAPSPSGRGSFGGSGGGSGSSGSSAHNHSFLDANDRNGLLVFARRSLKYAHDVFIHKIERGDVDPKLIITGWLLDLSASEDGVGTKTMANMKATLFGILRKWNLHLMDSDPRDVSVVGPSVSVEEHQAQMEVVKGGGGGGVGAQKTLADRARPWDARQIVKDPIERESLRRVVRIICASYLWTHALDQPPPAFEFNKIQIRQTEYDDYIHQNSPWLKSARLEPENYHNGGSRSDRTLSKLHDLWALYTRLVYMMNTPLVDLISGVGPEKDLQEAVSNMEHTLREIKASQPYLRFEEEEQPLRIHVYLDIRMVELLLYRHLFPLYAYTKNAGITFNETYTSARSVFPESSAPSNYEHFMGEQPYSYSVDNPYVSPDSNGYGGGGGGHSMAKGNGNPTPGLHFTRDPQRACFAPLFDIGRLVSAALVLLPRDRTLPVLPGSEAGAILPTAVRMLRWPRHLLLFAKHAFTLAAEVAVAGLAWDRLTSFGDDDPNWVSSPSMEDVPRQNSPVLVTKVWNIGCEIIDLMFAMAHAGSTHSSEMAVKAEKYKDQRATIMVGQGWCFRPRRGVAWSSGYVGGSGSSGGGGGRNSSAVPPPFAAGANGHGAAAQYLREDEFDPDDEEVVLSPGMGKWFEPGMFG